MVMEISPQHHKIVMGPGNETLRAITRRTGAQILFPDAKDPNIPSIKKSSVTITGHIHNVYAARQMLIVIFIDNSLNYFKVNMYLINSQIFNFRVHYHYFSCLIFHKTKWF